MYIQACPAFSETLKTVIAVLYVTKSLTPFL